MLMNRDLFDDLFRDLPFYTMTRTVDRYTLTYRQRTDKSGLTIETDIPGVKPEDVSVKVEDRNVTLTGKLRGESFEQRYRIPLGMYDMDSLEATHVNGVLTLTLKSTESTKPATKVIPIKTS